MVTDGTTLLGGDDKAGIAAILTAVEYLMNHPEIEHGKLRIAFTPMKRLVQGLNTLMCQLLGQILPIRLMAACRRRVSI